MGDKEHEILEAMQRLLRKSKELKVEHDRVIREFSRLNRELDKIQKAKNSGL